MKTFFYTLFGAILGTLVGIEGPILASFTLAWLGDFKPGAGAGTAFSLMIIFTCPLGLFVGARLGNRRARTGEWFWRRRQAAPWESVSGKEGTKTNNDVARSLTSARVNWFLTKNGGSWQAIPQETKKAFLAQAIDDYRIVLRKHLISPALMVALGLIIYPALLLAILFAGNVVRQVLRMRRRLSAVTEAMGIELSDEPFELPITLRPIPLQKIRGVFRRADTED